MSLPEYAPDRDMTALIGWHGREDARLARRMARAREQGHTACRCTRCGQRYPLSWVGEECNSERTGAMCEGRIASVFEGVRNPGDAEAMYVAGGNV